MDTGILLMVLGVLIIVLIMAFIAFSYAIARKNNQAYDLYRENDRCKITGLSCKGMSMWVGGGRDCRKCSIPFNEEYRRKDRE